MKIEKVEEILIVESVKKDLEKQKDKKLKHKLKKQLARFKENPYHPSLNTKRYHFIKADEYILWEIRIDRNQRAILKQDLENGMPTGRFTVVAIGEHDILKKFFNRMKKNF